MGHCYIGLVLKVMIPQPCYYHVPVHLQYLDGSKSHLLGVNKGSLTQFLLGTEKVEKQLEGISTLIYRALMEQRVGFMQLL